MKGLKGTDGLKVASELKQREIENPLAHIRKSRSRSPTPENLNRARQMLSQTYERANNMREILKLDLQSNTPNLN